MRPLIPALGAAALVAAAIVWAPLPGADDAAAPPAVPSPAANDPPAPAASPAIGYIRFAPGGAAADGGAAAAKPSPPLLVGLAGAGRGRTAYIVQGDATVRARIGDKVGGWRLAAIGPHSVTLRAPGKTMSLAFFGPRPTPPAPPAGLEPAAAPPGPPAPAAAAAPPPPPPVRGHALEPASAPVQYVAPSNGRRAPCYWVGSAERMPKGCTLLKPGQLPPP